MGKLARTVPVAAIVAGTLIASVSPAGAAVTIGQLAPSAPPAECHPGASPSDFAQAAVSSGNGYVVPPISPVIPQVVTSWSHNAAAGAGQTLKMKIWRQVTGLTYLVVGHDGPRNLTGGALNTFQTSIPVQPGDVLGINNQNAAMVPNACTFSATGDPGPLGNFGDTGDGAQTTFITNVINFRVNATALVEPDCDNDGFGDLDPGHGPLQLRPGHKSTTYRHYRPPGSPPGTAAGYLQGPRRRPSSVRTATTCAPARRVRM